MSSPEAKPNPRPRSSRRTVRIIEPRSTTRTATVSFLVITAAAVLLFVMWRLWRKDEPVIAPLPGPGEITLEWKCAAGHEFRAPAQVDPHPCKVCGRPAHPHGTWWCGKHGDFDVAVRLQLDAEGVLRPREYRILPNGEWTPATEPLLCPVCQAVLKRRYQDPLEDLTRSKKRGSPRGG